MKRPPLTFRTLIGLLLLGQAAWEKLRPAKPALPPAPPFNPHVAPPPSPDDLGEPEHGDPFRWPR